MPLQAQGWDAAGLARGWSRVDITNACAFLDAATQKIQLWSPDDSLFGTVPYQKIDRVPELWLFDSRNNAWIAAGTSLFNVDKNGKIVENLKLPAEVSDVTWDGKYMYLAFKTVSLYLEKRDLRSGEVAWSHGTRPTPQTRTQVPFFRIVLSDDGKRVLVAAGSDVDLQSLDAAAGKTIEALKLVPEAPVPAVIQVSDRGRLPIHGWPGRQMVLSAATTADLGQAGAATMHLLVNDLQARKIKQINTGLSTDHTFIGVLENRAAFTKPSGGLTYIPLS